MLTCPFPSMHNWLNILLHLHQPCAATLQRQSYLERALTASAAAERTECTPAAAFSHISEQGPCTALIPSSVPCCVQVPLCPFIDHRLTVWLHLHQPCAATAQRHLCSGPVLTAAAAAQTTSYTPARMAVSIMSLVEHGNALSSCQKRRAHRHISTFLFTKTVFKQGNLVFCNSKSPPKYSSQQFAVRGGKGNTRACSPLPGGQAA